QAEVTTVNKQLPRELNRDTALGETETLLRRLEAETAVLAVLRHAGQATGDELRTRVLGRDIRVAPAGEAVPLLEAEVLDRLLASDGSQDRRLVLVTREGDLVQHPDQLHREVGGRDAIGQHEDSLPVAVQCGLQKPCGLQLLLSDLHCSYSP